MRQIKTLLSSLFKLVILTLGFDHHAHSQPNPTNDNTIGIDFIIDGFSRRILAADSKRAFVAGSMTTDSFTPV